MAAMKSFVLWVSGGHPHPRLNRVKPGDGTSVMEVPGKNHSKQKHSVSMALFLTQNLFDASGIDLHMPSIASPLKSVHPVDQTAGYLSFLCALGFSSHRFLSAYSPVVILGLYTRAEEDSNDAKHQRVYCFGAQRSQQLHPWLIKLGGHPKESRTQWHLNFHEGTRTSLMCTDGEGAHALIRENDVIRNPVAGLASEVTIHTDNAS